MKKLLMFIVLCFVCQAGFAEIGERFPAPSSEAVLENEKIIMELGKAEVMGLSYLDLLDFLWDRYVLGPGKDFDYGGCNPKKLTSTEAQRPATILLHGAGSNQGHWVPFIDIKNKMEWGGPVFTYNFEQETDLQQLIAKIHSVCHVYANAGAEEVEIYLVGHSLGAICSAEYAFNPDLWVPGSKVTKVVALGGRLRNIEPPVETPYYPYCFDVLERVDRIWSQIEINRGVTQLITIAGSDDWLVPSESLFIGDESYLIPNQGHALINRFPACSRLVLELLYINN